MRFNTVPGKGMPRREKLEVKDEHVFTSRTKEVWEHFKQGKACVTAQRWKAGQHILTVYHIYGDGCEHNCVAGNVMRMELRWTRLMQEDQLGDECHSSRVGYNDGVRRWGNEPGDVFKNIDVKLAGLENWLVKRWGAEGIRTTLIMTLLRDNYEWSWINIGEKIKMTVKEFYLRCLWWTHNEQSVVKGVKC